MAQMLSLRQLNKIKAKETTNKNIIKRMRMIHLKSNLINKKP